MTGGLSPRLLDTNGDIVGPAWYRAFEAREVIGRCRRMKCDGLLVAQATHTDEGTTWYGAVCLSCGQEVASRNGHTLPKSSRRHLMPDGAWERRINYLTGLYKSAA